MGHTCEMHDEQPHPSQRSTGRPATIDPEAVAAIALQLFETRGYEAVSMDDIASAAGIGRKSLYRYFPNKAALVWGGLEEATAVSREILVVQHPATSDSILESLRRAAQETANSLPDFTVTRARLRLISARPELRAHSYSRLEAQRVMVANFLIGSGLEEPDAHFVAAAYSAALFAGWLRWAHGSDAHSLPHLMRALAVIRIPAL